MVFVQLFIGIEDEYDDEYEYEGEEGGLIFVLVLLLVLDNHITERRFRYAIRTTHI
jgi:hypothetical protein